MVLGSNGAVVHYGLGVSAAVIPQLYSYYFVTVVRIEEMFMGMDIFCQCSLNDLSVLSKI